MFIAIRWQIYREIILLQFRKIGVKLRENNLCQFRKIGVKLRENNFTPIPQDWSKNISNNQV